jgi:hypothetical protein
MHFSSSALMAPRIAILMSPMIVCRCAASSASRSAGGGAICRREEQHEQQEQ